MSNQLSKEAIVFLVLAVLAVGYVVMDGNTLSADVAGQAAKAMKPVLGDIDLNNICRATSQCGFAPKEAIDNLEDVVDDLKDDVLEFEDDFEGLQNAFMSKTGVEYIGFNEIKAFYGNGDFQKDFTAGIICKDMGFPTCVAGQALDTEFRFQSTDLTCGGIQLSIPSDKIVPCNYGSIKGSCDSDTNPFAVEPQKGDFRSNRMIMGVFCSK